MRNAASWGRKSVRILFDQGTPAPLRKWLTNHDVKTASEQGWSDLDNGDLLQAAESQFDLLVTTDKNLRYQQNLKGRRIAMLVLQLQAGRSCKGMPTLSRMRSTRWWRRNTVS
jgi:hypothetical protein